MFSGMFTVPVDEEGQVKMDRDPEVFELLIGYLRFPEKKVIFVRDEETKQRLMAEFNYWCIEAPTIKTPTDQANEFKDEFESFSSLLFKMNYYDPNAFAQTGPQDFETIKSQVRRKGWAEPLNQKVLIHRDNNTVTIGHLRTDPGLRPNLSLVPRQP